jgi:AmmeMemoRadiSam system protein A
VLTETQKASLLAIARAAIAAHFGGGPRPGCDDPGLPRADGLFVTLKRSGQLRGCLGRFACGPDLAAAVARCAVDSATEDPRFPAVTADEAPRLSVEISILGPLEPIDPVVAAAIVIGRDGLVVEQGRRRGLLLPQVASERGWTAEEFLRQTSIKAGLDADGWRTASVSRFTAVVFGDD